MTAKSDALTLAASKWESNTAKTPAPVRLRRAVFCPVRAADGERDGVPAPARFGS